MHCFLALGTLQRATRHWYMGSNFSVLQPKSDEAAGVARLRPEAAQNSQAPKAAGSVDTKLLSSTNWNSSKTDVELLSNAGATQMAFIYRKKKKVLLSVVAAITL